MAAAAPNSNTATTNTAKCLIIGMKPRTNVIVVRDLSNGQTYTVNMSPGEYKNPNITPYQLIMVKYNLSMNGHRTVTGHTPATTKEDHFVDGVVVMSSPKGFYFIQPDGAGENIFAHQNDVVDKVPLVVGDKVTFVPATGSKGKPVAAVVMSGAASQKALVKQNTSNQETVAEIKSDLNKTYRIVGKAVQTQRDESIWLVKISLDGTIVTARVVPGEILGPDARYVVIVTASVTGGHQGLNLMVTEAPKKSKKPVKELVVKHLGRQAQQQQQQQQQQQHARVVESASAAKPEVTEEDIVWLKAQLVQTQTEMAQLRAQLVQTQTEVAQLRAMVPPPSPCLTGGGYGGLPQSWGQQTMMPSPGGYAVLPKPPGCYMPAAPFMPPPPLKRNGGHDGAPLTSPREGGEFPDLGTAGLSAVTPPGSS